MTQTDLARILFWTAATEDRIDRAADAIRDFQLAAERFEGLDQADALPESNRGTLATCYHCIGRLHVDTGRPSEAIEPFRRAIAIREALHRSDPVNITHRDDYAGSWHRLGEAMEDLGRHDDAAAAYQKGLAYRRPLVNPAMGNVRFRKGLNEQLQDLHRLWIKMGRPAQALEIAQRKALWPDDPTVALGVAGEFATAAVQVQHGEIILTPLLSKAPSIRPRGPRDGARRHTAGREEVTSRSDALMRRTGDNSRHCQSKWRSLEPVNSLHRSPATFATTGFALHELLAQAVGAIKDPILPPLFGAELDEPLDLSFTATAVTGDLACPGAWNAEFLLANPNGDRFLLI